MLMDADMVFLVMCGVGGNGGVDELVFCGVVGKHKTPECAVGGF
jgi:hypothetical protein